jgi:hypothetical protein
MKRVLDHDVVSSFKEFLNYRILKYLSGYRNATLPLYPYSGNRKFVGKNMFATSSCQWVYDSAISGVQIPSGLGSLNRGVSGLIIDFKNGRLIVNSGVNLTGSIDVSIPDFNIYVTTTPIQKIVLENRFQYAPYLKAANQHIVSDSIIAPCIILSLTSSSSTPFELGGIDSANFMFQVGVLSDKMYHIMGVQKMIRDIARRVFPILGTTPLNEFNDLKDGVWNYNDAKTLATQADLFYINKTSFKIIDSDFLNENHPNLHLGLGTVSISKYGMTDYSDEYTVYSEEDFSVYEFDE